MARSALVSGNNPATLATNLNAAVETLEASGFVLQQLLPVELPDGTGGVIPGFVLLAVHQTYAGTGVFSADAAGRAKMAAGFFGGGVAASAAHFADGFWTNALVAKFADSLFAANAASRAKFVDGIWTTAKLAAGILSADADGRGKMAAGFFGQNDATSLAQFADGFFGSAQVVGSAPGAKFATGAKPLVQNGAPQQNRLFLATLPTAGDWISVEGTDAVVVPYEFRADSPPTGGTAGRIWVYDGGGAAAARVNLVDAINGVVDANRVARGAVADLAGFVARDAVAQTSVMIMEVAGSETARNLTENLTDGADIWDSATTVGGMLETRQRLVIQTLTINADQIAAGELIFSTGIQPVWALVINHNRPQNEAWAIIAATNAVALTLAGGAAPNNQAADVVTCIAIG